MTHQDVYFVNPISQGKWRKRFQWIRSAESKNILSFWLLGIAVDFGYWVILTSAHDLLSRGDDYVQTNASTHSRPCHHLSTGVILIANIVPNVAAKIVLPFLPLYINARTIVGIIASIVGFAIAAVYQTKIFTLSGVALSSLAVGIGESSYLMYLPYFKDKRVVYAWSSGTGASGFFASLVYLAMISNGISLSTTLLSMIVVPILMGFVFFFLMEHPQIEKLKNLDISIDHPVTEDQTSLKQKVRMMLNLLFSYSLPFFLVFLIQYTINQGIFELIFIGNKVTDLASQVRWFNFVYLLALLLSKSSGLVKINYLWLMVLLQGINLTLLATEAMYGWLGNKSSFWILIVIIFWEGIVAGVSYVNTYRKINSEVPADHRQFSMSINSVGASLGMLFAGVIAMPIHNYICKLPVA